MKIGIVPYLNCKPLTQFISKDHEVVALPPSEISDAILRDELDVALVPLYTIIRHNLRMHPDAGIIGCDGPVASVGFFTRSYIENLGQISSIYIDKESRSSAFLAKIILKKFYGISLYDLEFFHDDNKHMADAQLLIGDKALFFDKTKLPYQFTDIGEVWKQHTGAGFMFASWASKRPLTPSELNDLKIAREIGCQNIPEIVKNYDRDKQALIQNYLTHNIIFEPTPNIKNGLQLYKDFLAEFNYSSLMPKSAA